MDKESLSKFKRTPTIDKFEYVSRKEWGARKPRREMEQLNFQFPLPFVVMTYTNTPPCTTKEECKSRVNMIQALDMYENGLPDIKYKFPDRFPLASVAKWGEKTVAVTQHEFACSYFELVIVASWLVGNDGRIYEGLGWSTAATWCDPRHDPYRTNSLTFAFIENMDGKGPGPDSMVAMRILTVEAAKNKYIHHPLNIVRMFAKEDIDLENDVKIIGNKN